MGDRNAHIPIQRHPFLKLGLLSNLISPQSSYRNDSFKADSVNTPPRLEIPHRQSSKTHVRGVEASGAVDFVDFAGDTVSIVGFELSARVTYNNGNSESLCGCMLEESAWEPAARETNVQHRTPSTQVRNQRVSGGDRFRTRSGSSDTDDTGGSRPDHQDQDAEGDAGTEHNRQPDRVLL